MNFGYLCAEKAIKLFTRSSEFPLLLLAHITHKHTFAYFACSLTLAVLYACEWDRRAVEQAAPAVESPSLVVCEFCVYARLWGKNKSQHTDWRNSSSSSSERRKTDGRTDRLIVLTHRATRTDRPANTQRATHKKLGQRGTKILRYRFGRNTSKLQVTRSAHWMHFARTSRGSGPSAIAAALVMWMDICNLTKRCALEPWWWSKWPSSLLLQMADAANK